MSGISRVAWGEPARRAVAALFGPEPWCLSAHFAAERGEGELSVAERAGRAPAAAVRLVDTVLLAGEPDDVWAPWLAGLDLAPGYVVAPPHWHELIDAALPQSRPVEFAIYRWPEGQSPLSSAKEGTVPLPGAPAVRRLTVADTAALQRLGEAWVWKHFGSARRLLADSVVFGGCEGDRVVAVSAVFCWSPRYDDLAVATHPERRGQDWATRCTAAMVADSLARGRCPVWKARADHHASRRVAEKLGFELIDEVAVFRLE